MKKYLPINTQSFSRLTLFLLFLPTIALAQTDKISSRDCVSWGVWCTATQAKNYIWRGINTILSLLATVAVAALVYYSILYVMSRGEEQQLQRAKTGIVYAILGLFIAGLAAWVVNSIINL